MGLCCVTLLVALTGVAAGDEPKSNQATANAEITAISDADLSELIKQLNADRFSIRQAATKRLAEAGVGIIPKLIEAAEQGPSETTARVVEILEKHFKSDDPQTKKTAEQALQRLAKNNQANVSRFARRALGEAAPEDTAAKREVGPNNNPQPPFQFRNGQFQIQLQVGGGGRKVTRRNVNGVKDATIEENGRQIKIHEEPNGKVKVTITEDDENGQKKTKEYQADSLDELKKKHPEGHKLYQQHATENGVGPIQIGQFPAVPPIQPQPGAEVQKLKRILEQLKEMNLKDIDEETRASLQEQLDRLRKAQQRE